MSSSPLIRNEEPRDAQVVAAIVERAFGPGRYAKAAERLREGNTPRLDLSFVAEIDGRLAGSVRLWPIKVGGRPAMLLGPILHIALTRATNGRYYTPVVASVRETGGVS